VSFVLKPTFFSYPSEGAKCPFEGENTVCFPTWSGISAKPGSSFCWVCICFVGHGMNARPTKVEDTASGVKNLLYCVKQNQFSNALPPKKGGA
jgi:hypothetical protein